MKNIQLKMWTRSQNNEEKDLQFSATEVTEEQGTTIIENMFAAFGVQTIRTTCGELTPPQYAGGLVAAGAELLETPNDVPYHPMAAPLKSFPTIKEENRIQMELEQELKPLSVKQDEELAKAKEDVTVRPKQLPLVGGERSTFSLADDPKMAKLMEAATTIVDKTPKAQQAIDERPTHVKTGVKVVDINGVPTQTFRARCNCPKCGWVGNRYVRPDSRYAKCYDCNTRLDVIPATSQPMVPDEWNNFFHANQEYIDV